MSYKVGDTVRIKIHEDSNGWLHLVANDETFPPDENECCWKYVKICGCYQMSSSDFIALCDFDPHSYISWKITHWHQRGYDVSDKFLGMRGTFISTNHIWEIQPPPPVRQLKLAGGCHCKLCKLYMPYTSLPNRDDGTFVCHKCLSTKGWMLTCKPLKN